MFEDLFADLKKLRGVEVEEDHVREADLQETLGIAQKIISVIVSQNPCDDNNWITIYYRPTLKRITEVEYGGYDGVGKICTAVDKEMVNRITRINNVVKKYM